MKKLILVFCLICFALPSLAEDCTKFKNLCFSKIYYDIYKRPVITWENHNKTVNWHAGAENLCVSIGMRLPSINETDILIQYLNNTLIADKKNISFWLQETATGQIGNIYINENSTSNKYTLTYNSVVRPIQTFISPINKTSGMSSGICAICVKEVPPLTVEDKINLLKEDYKGYIDGKNAYYGYVENSLKDLKWGINYKINKTYLEKIKCKLDEIIKLENNVNNYNLTIIEIEKDDYIKLYDNTKRLIYLFNDIVQNDYI